MEQAAINLAMLRPRRSLLVAVVSETYSPEVNGVALTTERLVQGLVECGHRVQLIRPIQAGETRSPLTRDGDALSVTAVPGMKIPLYRHLQLGLPARRTLARLWRQERPDAVHIVTEGPLGVSALRLSRELGLAVSSGFHTNFQNYSRYYRLGFLQNRIVSYLRWFHNRCQCTLVPTEELREELARQGFRNLRLLARGVDTGLFSPARQDATLRERWGVGPGQLAVLHVGRLAAEKNLQLAVAAFDGIRREHPGARFVLVGDGPLAGSLRKSRPDFVFCGTRHGEDLAAHYASADLFLFPSLTETFGNVTLEAMASGLAVVAFDYAAARQHIVQGRSGIRVACGEETAFVAAACRLSRWPEQLRSLGREARRTAEVLDWSLISRDLEDLFFEYTR